MAPNSSAASDTPDIDAPSSAPVRALLWLQPDTDEVLDRVRGQTSDLRVELLVDAFEPMSADIGAQLRTAQTLSAQQNAALVIWFVKQASGERHFIVNIAIPKTRRLLTRDLGPYNASSSDARVSSAVKESAALVVRAAIQAVLSGSTIGEQDTVALEERSDADAGTTPNSESAEPEAATNRSQNAASLAPQARNGEVIAASAGSKEQPTSSGHSRWPWALGAEWLLLHDNAQNKQFAECASLRAGRRVHWVKGFALASACLNREIDAGSYGRFRIARQEAAVGASAILWQAGVEASLGAQVGAVFYERTTLPAPGAAPAKTHVMAAMGPLFQLLVPTRGTRIQAGFVVGLDFVTGSLRIGYNDAATPAPSHFAPIARISVVQPYATLGLAFRL